MSDPKHEKPAINQTKPSDPPETNQRHTSTNPIQNLWAAVIFASSVYTVSAAMISPNQSNLFLSGAVPGSTPGNLSPSTTNLMSEATFDPQLQPDGIWQGEVGGGFRPAVQTISLEAGATAGVQIFGGRQKHDLILSSLSYGHMWGDAKGEDHWYRGNWEIRGELFGGEQFSPVSDDWLIGLTPHLRYNLATGTRWIPFVDAGAGVTATGIEGPDLSGTFEFNLQANTGFHWFVKDKMAVTAEVGYLHISCAGIHDPNLGLNTIKGMAGLTWFF